MSDAEGHPGKLRGVYRRSFKIFSLVSLMLTLSALLFVQTYAVPLLILNAFSAFVTVYFGLRIGSAYAYQSNSEKDENIDAWTWLIHQLGLILLVVLLIEYHTGNGPSVFSESELEGASVLLHFLLIAPIVHAYYSGGRKLAWLAGDKIGGRSTFLRFLQLGYWPLTFNYIRLHTREPKRPFKADHP